MSISGWSSIYRCTTGVFSRFQFEESVSTFTAGLFSLERGKPVPALVYVTFNGRIQVQTADLSPELGKVGFKGAGDFLLYLSVCT